MSLSGMQDPRLRLFASFACETVAAFSLHLASRAEQAAEMRGWVVVGRVWWVTIKLRGDDLTNTDRCSAETPWACHY